MLKRILIVGIPAIIVTGLLFIVLFRSKHSYQKADAAEAVPANAVLFIEKLDYRFFSEEFETESQLWADLLTYRYFNEFDSLFQQLHDHLNRMPLLRKCLESGQLSLSIHLLGKDRLSALFYVSPGENVSFSELDHELNSVFDIGVIVNERRYETVILKDVSFRNNNNVKGFSYAITGGLLIAGTSSILLEDAIRTLNSNSGIYFQKGFKKVAPTAGKYVLGNLYLNYPFLDQLFFPLINNEMHYKLSPVSELASWGEFDIDLREDVMLLHGMTFADDSLGNWLNLFQGQRPVRMDATSFIPSNAIEFMAVGISDVQRFANRFKEELEERDELLEFQSADNQSKMSVEESIFSGILEMVSDEIVWFTMEDNRKESYNEVVMVEIRSHSETLNRLTHWIDEMAAVREEDSKQYTDSFQLDDQIGYNIFNFPEQFYQHYIIRKFIKSHFALYDNYIVFSDSKEAISRTIYQNILHKTLINEVYFEDLNNLMSTKSNFTYFFNPGSYMARKDYMLKKPVKQVTKELSQPIRKIPGIIIQYVTEGEMFYSSISLGYTSQIKEKAHTVWESLLDSTAIGKPYLTINHYTSEKEIVVQDAKNTVYLINSTGRILWKVRLDGPVMGEIFQVDYYNNGKLQYLFNTATGIHLLDRNGNYVERYPIKLRADATNGLALFDYDKRKEYRIFVACENREVYVYDIEGNIVPGWKFPSSEGTVQKPVQHFRIGDKDYIVFSDQIRAYILDRRGDERILIKDPVIASNNNVFYLDMNISGRGPRFITSEVSGDIIGINLNGEVETVFEHTATSDHFFRIKDINQDGNTEFIYADKNLLEIFDLKGKRLFSFKINGGSIRSLPDIYEFSSSDLKIGMTDMENNLIYLINSDGTLYEGFPLEGNTRYSIGYFAGFDSRFNLIVGSQNGFLYNYSIE
ncbi:MAG: hypothetical protein WD577_10775 [Bacteroidales bacterium]